MTEFKKKSIAVEILRMDYWAKPVDGFLPSVWRSPEPTVTRAHDGNLIVHGDQTHHVWSAGMLELNRAGNNNRSIADTRSTVAITGDAVVIGKRSDLQHAPGSEWGRSAYWSVPGRSYIDEMLAVVCVPWGPQSKPVFRPPAIGVGSVARHMRQAPVFEEQMVLSRLPSVIDLSTLPNVPPVSYFERLFSDFCGELYDGWSTDTRTPDLQHHGYGTWLAGNLGQALVWLCSTQPIEEKRALARSMVQWGLDLAGAFSDGRNNSAVGGGHMAGRKALILLAGHLLGVEPLRDPNAFVGRVFMEDNAFTERGWRHSAGAEERAGPWSEQRLWDAQTKLEMSYIDQVGGAQIGTALAMHLMGLSREMGDNHFDFCQWWMNARAGDPCFDAYKRNLMAPSWGHDYSVGGGNGMCAAAWRQVMS